MRELDKNSETLMLNWFRQELSLDVLGWMANGELGIHSMPKEHHTDNSLVTKVKT